MSDFAFIATFWLSEHSSINPNRDKMRKFLISRFKLFFVVKKLNFSAHIGENEVERKVFFESRWIIVETTIKKSKRSLELPKAFTKADYFQWKNLGRRNW